MSEEVKVSNGHHQTGSTKDGHHHSSHSGSRHHHSGSGDDSKYAERKIRRFISYILGTFVCICLLICFWGITIRSGLMSTSLLERSLTASGYYENKAEELTDNLKDLLRDSNIDTEVAEGVVTDRMVVLNTHAYITDMEAKIPVEYDTSEFEDALSSNIKNYLELQGVRSDDDLDKYITLLASKAAADFESGIAFPFITYYMDFMEKFDLISILMIVIPIPIIALCLVILLFMHRMKYRGLRYGNYGICAASVLGVITSFIMKYRFMGIVKGDESVYAEFFREYISGAMRQGIYSALAGIMIFGIIIIVTYYLRKKAI